MKTIWTIDESGVGLIPIFLMALLSFGTSFSQVLVNGEQRIWHTTTLLFEGPQTAEDNLNNPFLNFRFDVTFISPSGNTFLVPGYFAADGNAAETGATSGNKWAVHFTPDEIGNWTYLVSFRTGNEVAVSLSPSAGVPVSFDGSSGNIEIIANNKSLPDNRARGRLNYVGERYPKFQGNDQYFIKVGADSPENLLAHKDFDNSVTSKDWSPHIPDWQTGDPLWQGDKGKGLIGAINYLSSKGMNAFAFNMFNLDDPSTNNDGGDRTIWPWSSDNIPLMEGSGPASVDSRMRYDVSKLAQWEIFFEHADNKGMFLHFKTQERGNMKLLDAGDLGVQRKLYYREIIARFSHHLALNWNLGEEFHIYDPELVNRLTNYIKAIDPYDHLIVLHTFPGQQDRSYTPLLGSSGTLTGASLQIDINQVHEEVKRWTTASAASGKPWIVSSDEQGHWKVGVAVDEDYQGNHGSEPDNRRAVRHRVLWGTLMAGGFGVEYYFGTQTGETDWSSENWRSRATKWEDAKIAYDFFNAYLNFWKMESRDSLTSYTSDYCLADIGTTYVIYLPGGSTTTLDLSDISGNFSVNWFDPRVGGNLRQSNITAINGGGWRTLGNPPGDINQDWVALIQREDSATIPVSELNILPRTLSLLEGEVYTFTKEVLPLNATDKEVLWSTDNTAVAVVDQFGTVTALNEGDATLTARTLEGNHTATASISVLPLPPTNRITGFTLIDADNNTELLELTDNGIINISNIPEGQFNVRAKVSGEEVQSVRMQLSGPLSRDWTEHLEPFALFGDQSGDYFGSALAEGNYVLTATPFTGPEATGDEGQSLVISFTISTNMEALNQAPVAEINSTDLIGTVPLSVEFDGSYSWDDNEIHSYFWDFDDGNTSSNAIAVHTFTEVGVYEVVLRVTDASGLSGTDTLTIIAEAGTTLPNSPFTMVDGATNTELFEITNAMNIDTDSMLNQPVNIRANISVDTVQSVGFILNGKITRAWTENQAPFMLFGKTDAKSPGQILEAGNYFLEARAYSGPQLSGMLLETIAVEFSVLENNAQKDAGYDPKANSQNPINLAYKPGKGSIKLHPNPATNFMHAELSDNNLEITKLLVYNISGSLVQSYFNTSKILQSDGTYKINTTRLAAGIYLLKAYTNTFDTFHYKLVVSNK